METSITNPTPKNEFLADKKACSEHRNMMQNPAMRRSLATALSQYNRMLAEARISELGAAAVNHFKAQGAAEYMATLINLAEAPSGPPPRTVTNQLNPKA